MRVRSSCSQQRWEWSGEGVGWGWLHVVQSTSTVADVLQEVPAGGSPPFPTQNPISKAHWAPGIRLKSHTAVLAVSGEKQRSRVPWGGAILLGFFFFQIISMKALSSTLPSFGTDFPANSIPSHSVCHSRTIKRTQIHWEWTFPMQTAECHL